MDGDGAGGLMGMSGPMWMPQDYPTWTRIFELHPQPVPIVPVLSLLGLVLYLWGVRTLRRRHDRWPWWRTVSWVLGIGITVAVTATGQVLVNKSPLTATGGSNSCAVMNWASTGLQRMCRSACFCRRKKGTSPST